DAPRPAEDAEVEVEDPARIPAGEEQHEEHPDREYEEREPEEQQHDVVRDQEQPLDEPEPPRRALEVPFETGGVRGRDGRHDGSSFRPDAGIGHDATPYGSRSARRADRGNRRPLPWSTAERQH